MLIMWILTALTFISGFVLGFLYREPKRVQDAIEVVKSITRKDDKRLGEVKPLSVRDRAIKGTRLEETEIAMTELLDEIL